LAGLASNKFTTKTLFQQFCRMESFTPSSKYFIFFMTLDIG